MNRARAVIETSPTGARRCSSALRWAAALGGPGLPHRAELQEAPSFERRCGAAESCPRSKSGCRKSRRLRSWKRIGTPGGELRMLMGEPQGHPHDGGLRLCEAGRVHAHRSNLRRTFSSRSMSRTIGSSRLHLRKGHKWSDGQPFTTEDFRYWFEDVAQNNHLSPSGLPISMLPQGEGPRFEVLDETTVRYSWARPNPLFLPDLAGPSPLYIYRPSHYLKQFHQKYAEKDALDALVKQAKQRNWAALHNKLDTMYRDDNPDLPSLEPWILKTRPPADRFHIRKKPVLLSDRQGRAISFRTSIG